MKRKKVYNVKIIKNTILTLSVLMVAQVSGMERSPQSAAALEESLQARIRRLVQATDFEAERARWYNACARLEAMAADFKSAQEMVQKCIHEEKAKYVEKIFCMNCGLHKRKKIVTKEQWQ
jgi:hypothetical protein